MENGSTVLDDGIVAARVRKVLADTHTSQRTLARELGRNEVYVSRRLTGHVPFGAVELARVAAVLDVDVAELLAA